MGISRVLLVDDDELVRYSLTKILEEYGFEITTASNVPDALKSITTDQYDVLLSDLQMPGPGDGLTVVSAMRHSNPRAVTLLLSAFPDLEKAADAILLQADEIIVKPVDALSLIETIQHRLAAAPQASRRTETVADILERDMNQTIERWCEAVVRSELLMSVNVSPEERSTYLVRLLIDLIARLRSRQPIGAYRVPSPSSVDHGADRYYQRYSTAMIVEESRYLQVSIFETLQINLMYVDFSVVLAEVMIIADHVDYQLSQMMTGYEKASSA